MEFKLFFKQLETKLLDYPGLFVYGLRKWEARRQGCGLSPERAMTLPTTPGKALSCGSHLYTCLAFCLSCDFTAL